MIYKHNYEFYGTFPINASANECKYLQSQCHLDHMQLGDNMRKNSAQWTFSLWKSWIFLFLMSYFYKTLQMQFCICNFIFSYSHPKEFCTTLQKSLDMENFLRGRKFVKSLTSIPWGKKNHMILTIIFRWWNN